MEARTPEVRSVTPQRSSLPLQKLVCNRSPLVFVVPGFGSWCKAFCLIARPKSFQCCTEPSCWVITLCLYGNHQEIQCKCHVLACKKYTGEEKAIGIWCTEIKYPKFSAVADCYALQRLTDYREGLLFASESQRSCIIHA